MKKILLITAFFIFSIMGTAQSLIPQFYKTVTFLYRTNGKESIPQGTGFFVSVPAKSLNGNYIYLVTAKHVLLNPDKKPLTVINAKLNTSDSSEMFRIPLEWSGANKTVFVHPDASVDIAIIPVIIPEHISFLHISIDQILKRSEFDSLGINVGTDVFFTGLFTAYTGNRTINPIFRFGKVCLIPKEKIEFNNIERQVILIESSSFGGNSGSPVIFQYQKDNKTHVRLAGVILGSFNQGQSLSKKGNEEVIAWSSIGISAITPSEFILDIINSIEIASKRDL